MTGSVFEYSRWIRESNIFLMGILFITIIVFLPFVALVTSKFTNPNELVLSLSWVVGTVVLSLYGVIHLLAATADTKQFLDDHGTTYGSSATVFCHALAQRLLVLLVIGFALVLLTILGAGVGVPPILLIFLGMFGAVLIGPPTAIPMNRRVSKRLTEYRRE